MTSEVKKNGKGKPKLPENIEEYLQTFSLSDWPEIPNEITLPDYNIDNILGTKDDVFNLLKESVIDNNKTMEKLQERTDNMEILIAQYKSHLFSEETRISKIKQNVFYCPEKFFMTEAQSTNRASEEGKILSGHRRKKRLIDEKQKKRVENVIYLGFNTNELSDLPGFLEAPQILNLVTNLMGFKPSFLRFWTPIVRSEASNAILLDAFWWFFLHYFKRDPNLEEDKYLYFSRISDSFVALFLSVDSSLRDKVFHVYADFLSQAIYTTFYRAFPDSRLQLNDDFKQEICNIVNEWILGIKPIPESYREWKTEADLNIAMNPEGKTASTNEILHKIGNLEKLLKSLGNENEMPHPIKIESGVSRKTSVMKRNETKLRQIDSANKVFTSFYDNKLKQSHVVGESAVMEKVFFNTKGRSILISHYMNMHNLQESEPLTHRVTRTQILQKPPQTARTYKDVIYATLERTKSLNEDFQKISQQNEEEIRKIEKNIRDIRSGRDKPRSGSGSPIKREKSTHESQRVDFSASVPDLKQATTQSVLLSEDGNDYYYSEQIKSLTDLQDIDN